MKVSLDDWNKCKRKIGYGHKATAKRAIEAMARKGSTGLSWYECDYCDGFHIVIAAGWLVSGGFF